MIRIGGTSSAGNLHLTHFQDLVQVQTHGFLGPSVTSIRLGSKRGPMRIGPRLVLFRSLGSGDFRGTMATSCHFKLGLSMGNPQAMVGDWATPLKNMVRQLG